MAEIALAFLWHQHQPYYPDDVAGDNPMPWVRLLDNFFMANYDQMVRPFARYVELHQRRGFGRNTAREALRRFHERDYRDLQVWFNLTWVHPLAFERDAGLRALRDKGRHFTEEEKSWLLDKHLEILREIIPLHRKLAESGQVELTT